MSCRGVTLQTRAASAAESRRRDSTSPSLAIRIRARTSRVSDSAMRSPSASAASDRATAEMVVGARGRVNKRDRWRFDTHVPGLAARRLQSLAVRDLHGRVIAAELLPVPLRPHAQDLDADDVLRVA